MSQRTATSYCFLLVGLLALFFPAPALAQSITDSLSLTIPSGIAGALYILVGLALVFFGFRLSRVLLFLVGAYILSTLAYIALRNLEPSAGYPSREWVYLGVGIGAGLIGGALFVCLYKLAIVGLGAFAGFTLASYILTFQTGSLISSGIGRAIFIIVVCVIGAVLAFYFERIAIIVASSIIGAVSVVLGVDVFAQTGVTGNLTQAVLAAQSSSSFDFGGVSVPGYVLLASAAVLAVVGALVQFRTNRGRDFLPHKR